MSNNHYIYSWSTQEGVPFYIGQGRHNKDYKYARAFHIHYIRYKGKSLAFCQRKANKLKYIGNPHVVTILHDNLTTEQANEHEKMLISKYGRIDNNTGILCNMTDGGEINPMNDPNNIEKLKKTLNDPEHVEKVRIKAINRWKDPNYINKTRKSIAFNGVVYNTYKELSIFLGIKETTLHNRIKKGIPLDSPIDNRKSHG